MQYYSLIFINIPPIALQVDISNATQFVEYVRILTRLAQLGITHNLYAGSNSAVSSIKNNTGGAVGKNEQRGHSFNSIFASTAGKEQYLTRPAAFIITLSL